MLTQIDLPVSGLVLSALERIDRLRSAWQASETAPEQLASSEEAARIRAVGASCRLSGIRLSDDEVADVLIDASLQPTDACHTRGYADAVARALPGSHELLTCEDLRAMHAVLMGEGAHLSPYRTQAYHPEAFDENGQAVGRVFSTLPPHLIESKLEELTTWLEFEMRTGDRHPALVIGAFTLGLMAACPFDGGNGRLARLLIPKLMLRAGYGYAPYAAIEPYFEENRQDFYESYDLSQTHFWKGSGQLGPWIDFFVGMLKLHAAEIEARFGLHGEDEDLPPLQQAIVESVQRHGVVDAGLLLKETGANRNTLKDNLRRLVDRGLLERTGKKRGTRYHAPGLKQAATATAAAAAGGE